MQLGRLIIHIVKASPKLALAGRLAGWEQPHNTAGDSTVGQSKIERERDPKKQKESRDVTSRTRKCEGPMSLISPITSHALLRAPPSQGRSRATPWIGLRLGSHESNSQSVHGAARAGAPGCVGACMLCGCLPLVCGLYRTAGERRLSLRLTCLPFCPRPPAFPRSTCRPGAKSTSEAVASGKLGKLLLFYSSSCRWIMDMDMDMDRDTEPGPGPGQGPG